MTPAETERTRVASANCGAAAFLPLPALARHPTLLDAVFVVGCYLQSVNSAAQTRLS